MTVMNNRLSASMLLEQIYWARDLYFVFVDKNLAGMMAFLDAYHGYQRPVLNRDSLHSHSGFIVGAFALKARGSLFDSMNIEYNMINGQLPNLDLLNLMVKLADKFGLYPMVFDHGHQQSWWDLANTTKKAMYTQVTVR